MTAQQPHEAAQTRSTPGSPSELSAPAWQVEAAVALLDGGATVPFIARYRKEATGSLDDAQLRLLAERLDYLRELRGPPGGDPGIDCRRRASSPTRWPRRSPPPTPRPGSRTSTCRSRPKRRTKAQIAREAGLEPLADLLIGDPTHDPSHCRSAFRRPRTAGVEDAAQALTGARAILAERFGEDADLVGELREMLWQRGRLTSSRARTRQAKDAAKFADYFDFSQPLKSPSVAPDSGDVPGRGAGRADA